MVMYVFFFYANVLQESPLSKESMEQTPWILTSVDPFRQKFQSNQGDVDQRSRQDKLDQRFEFEMKTLYLTMCVHFADGLGVLLQLAFLCAL